MTSARYIKDMDETIRLLLFNDKANFCSDTKIVSISYQSIDFHKDPRSTSDCFRSIMVNRVKAMKPILVMIDRDMDPVQIHFPVRQKKIQIRINYIDHLLHR